MSSSTQGSSAPLPPNAVGDRRVSETEAEVDSRRRHGWLTGRSGLVIPLILAAVATWLVWGNLTMQLPKKADFPGPTFVPWILAVAGYVLAALLVVDVIRHPVVPEETSGRTYATHSDWSAVAWCVGGFVLFALTLELLGWILAAALLFWCVARGIGSKRPLFDVSLALVMSSVVYLAFSVGLGLTLPSGVIGGGW